MLGSAGEGCAWTAVVRAREYRTRCESYLGGKYVISNFHARFMVCHLKNQQSPLALTPNGSSNSLIHFPITPYAAWSASLRVGSPQDRVQQARPTGPPSGKNGIEEVSLDVEHPLHGARSDTKFGGTAFRPGLRLGRRAWMFRACVTVTI